MKELELWLNMATRRLSKESAARVRAEIGEHYESAREAALSTGASAAEAERRAVAGLGDAKTANCQYRKVLLTSSEAKVLSNANAEAQAFCSGPLLKWLLLVVSAPVLYGSIAFYLTGAEVVARALALGWMIIALSSGAPFLPVYTPSRGRVFRCVRWALLVGALGMGLHWSWLFFSCLWPLAWVEWTRASIRRKLPVSEWPPQLYL